MATIERPRAAAGLSGPRLLLGAALVLATLWGVWATHEICTLKARTVVTVKLSGLMSDFIATEARSGRSAADTQLRIAAYLKAIEASVAALGREGRTVLVAEAVVAGAAPDLTDSVRRDVARRMEALSHAAR